MQIKRVNINGVEYVPLAALRLAAEPQAKESAGLIAAAIEMARASDDVGGDGGLARFDDATTKLKRAARAFERRAAQ